MFEGQWFPRRLPAVARFLQAEVYQASPGREGAEATLTGTVFGLTGRGRDDDWAQSSLTRQLLGSLIADALRDDSHAVSPRSPELSDARREIVDWLFFQAQVDSRPALGSGSDLAVIGFEPLPDLPDFLDAATADATVTAQAEGGFIARAARYDMSGTGATEESARTALRAGLVAVALVKSCYNLPVEGAEYGTPVYSSILNFTASQTSCVIPPSHVRLAKEYHAPEGPAASGGLAASQGLAE